MAKQIVVKDVIKDIVNYIQCKVLKHRKSIFTYHIRPQFAEDYEIEQSDFAKGKKVGIIVQGNICYKYNFTFETIKLYKKLYPTCYIVLSTWNNEDPLLIKKIELLGVDVILSEYPNNAGNGHLNYQLKSTAEGIYFLKKKGCEYILKTRTDQRICSEMNITYLLDILKVYPSSRITNAGRIVVCSNGCFFGRLYNVTDMLLFGKTKDIEMYFSAPQDLRDSIDYSQKDQVEYSKKRPGEIYLTTSYIERLGFELKWTAEDSDFYMKELFVIVDSESMDWIWLKYNRREYKWRLYNSRFLRPITHKDWLRLYIDD